MTACVVALALVAAVAVAACGGDVDAFENDIAAATEVVEVPVEVLEPIGKDVYAFVSSSEARLDAFEIEVGAVDRFGTFTEPPERETLQFVRDPVSFGSLAPVLERAETVVVILIPLLDPTRLYGFDFDARFVGLDGDGAVVSSDYSEADEELIAEIIAEGPSPGAALARHGG